MLFNNDDNQPLDVKTLIQTIKSHLYNRDFDSAFTDANEDLLRAYALRWSASRALGYVNIFRGVLDHYFLSFSFPSLVNDSDSHEHSHLYPDLSSNSVIPPSYNPATQVVCIGGGGGAEIVALAAVWRVLVNDIYQLQSGNGGSKNNIGANDADGQVQTISDGIADTSIREMTVTDKEKEKEQEQGDSETASKKFCHSWNNISIKIKAIDIADWSTVVDRLSRTIKSSTTPSSKDYPAPLVAPVGAGAAGGGGRPVQFSSSGEQLAQTGDVGDDFSVEFVRADVLSLNEKELDQLYHHNGGSGSKKSQEKSTAATSVVPEEESQQQKHQQPRKTILVTLMFTLNELFSTSMAKATSFLLQTTDVIEPGTMLLIVDSPGSYSTLKLGRRGGEGEGESQKQQQQERRYPMKFLLDHTLLSVAKGKWEKVFCRDSQWWRRDVTRLRYDIGGEGTGLEDMRFQIHLYKRLG